MKRSIAVLIADIHGGHTLGLINPDTILEKKDTGIIQKYKPELDTTQEYLWGINLQAIQLTKELAGKDPIHIFSLGELTHGNRFMQELVSTKLSDQPMIAKYDLLPWVSLKNVESIRLVPGTGVHEFGEGSATEIVREYLHGDFPNKDIRSVYHGLASIDGFTLDYTHHGPTAGKRNWLKGNEALLYTKSLVQDELDRGHTPPKLVARGHNHGYVRSCYWKRTNGKEYTTWFVLVPSMSIINEHARKVAQSPYLSTNGIVVAEVVDGKLLDMYFFGQTLDLRTEEEL